MKNKYLLVFLTIIAFISCSDETTYFDENQENPRIDLILEENISVLSSGIKDDSNRILGIYFEHELSGKQKSLVSKTTSDFHMNLVGQVSRPSFNENSNLTATHVDYKDNYAYVSYNTIGENFAGAVDVIDLSNPLSPVLASRMYMNNVDATVILYDNGYLYVLGSVDMERVLEATDGAYIAKIGVNKGNIDLTNVNYFYQQGNTATGITKIDDSFYVSSVVNVSIAKYDGTNFLKSNEVIFDDFRSVTSENGKLAILDANTGVTIMVNRLSQIKDKY